MNRGMPVRNTVPEEKMPQRTRIVERVDEVVSDVEGLVAIAIAIEEGDTALRDRLRPALITVLYIAAERLREANTNLACLARLVADSRPANVP